MEPANHVHCPRLSDTVEPGTGMAQTASFLFLETQRRKSDQSVHFDADLYKRFNSCSKNPGHLLFIDVNTVRLEHLPKQYQDDNLILDLVKALSDLTCLLKVVYVSPDRSQGFPFYKYRGRNDFTRSGTGWIEYVDVYTAKGRNNPRNKPCPCQTCQRSCEPRSEWAKVWLSTACHLTFDKSEAEDCKCYLFYDSPQQKLTDCPVISGHVELVNSNTEKDNSHFVFITHDVFLAKKLRQMISHCNRLCVRANIKYSTSITVKDGHATDISNSDDIEETDISNSDDIEETDISSSDNIEETDISSSDNIEETDISRKRRNNSEEKHANCFHNKKIRTDTHFNPLHPLVIIISHVHGCSKMVTFGHVTQRLAEDSMNPEFSRYEYTTATCPGSSGALVYILGRKLQIKPRHVHSRSVLGQGCEQVNRSGGGVG